MIITLDGLDASGKETISNLLKVKLENFLKKEGLVQNPFVEVIHFPDYDTVTGKCIKQILNGEVTFSREEVANLFILNRVETLAPIKDYLESDEHIFIFDRSFYSNFIYQCCGLTSFEVVNFTRSLLQKEFGVYGLPFPKYSFFLEVPFATIEERINNRRTNNVENKHDGKDIYEEISFLKNVFQVSEQLMLMQMVFPDELLFPRNSLLIEHQTPSDICNYIFNIIIESEYPPKDKEILVEVKDQIEESDNNEHDSSDKE